MLPGGEAAILCHKDESHMLGIVEQKARRTFQKVVTALTASCRTVWVLRLSHHGHVSVTCRNSEPLLGHLGDPHGAQQKNQHRAGA